jgi:hypothetical protein
MRIRVIAIVLLAALSGVASGQRRKAPKPKERQVKRDLLTLRYKPQAGTLLYNIHTDISQRVLENMTELSGVFSTSAQLAIHNVSIDYAKGLWSFDRYFTSLDIRGKDLRGNEVNLTEPNAINKTTRFTYQMTGDEVQHTVLTPIILLNADAQTYAYFIRPPALLAPLPKGMVTYGDTWIEKTEDTINVHDTVNIGTTDGMYIYKVGRVYKLDRLTDSVGSHIAVIVAQNDGWFDGNQSNSVTGIDLKLHGPVTGTDTLYLDLLSGRLMSRTTDLHIPVSVETEGRAPLTDVLDVHRSMVLDESNALELKKSGSEE